MGFELRQNTRESHWHALLAHAPVCSNHLLTQLSFEKMTPQECIDLLVNKVGHERDNATAEVRRWLDQQVQSALPDRVFDWWIAAVLDV